MCRSSFHKEAFKWNFPKSVYEPSELITTNTDLIYLKKPEMNLLFRPKKFKFIDLIS